MDLGDLRAEVNSHGFTAPVYTDARINTYLNDGQSFIATRVDFYAEEGTQATSTVSGTASYAWPTDMARMRSLFDTNRNIELEAVDLRMIDRSAVVTGAPMYYALDGMNVHLYPTPDGVYSLEMRYWKMPTAMAADSDTPSSLPVDWHHLLWRYAVAQCYWADDDAQNGQVMMQDFNGWLSMFTADAKFPNTDRSHQVAGMWDGDSSIRRPGWSYPWAY